MSDDRWLDVAGAILDGAPVAWDTLPNTGTDDDPVSVDDLQLLADVARAHRTADTGEANLWGSLELLERIGRGTFGDVYRARDTALDRDVALKLLAHRAPVRVTEEGRLLARVRHPNVVTVYGAAEHHGRYGIWMEFVRGRTLAAVVAEDGPLAWRVVAQIGVDVCRALGAVHASGLLHGDVKAQNVMREDGGRIVLMDFGTGRCAADPTAQNRLAGTPLYLAPEVLNGQAPDVRADVYSTGVLLYYLLTGAFPIQGRTLEDVRAAHAAGARISIRDRHADVPGRLAGVIDGATSPEAAGRFDSATAFEGALADAAQDRRRSAAVRAAWSVAATLLLAAVVGFGWWASSVMVKPIAFQPRDWILLTTFENRTGDRQFDRAIEYALERELGNSSWVNVAPRERIEDALRLMKRPADSVVDAAAGPEVAQRDGGIRIVVDGAIERAGLGYAMTVRIVDPRRAASLATHREQAPTAGDIPATVLRLSNWIRVTLGEAQATVNQNSEHLEKATTPSLRALRLYSDALSAFNFNRYSEAETLLRSALAEDPDFPSANIWMAWALHNRGRPPDVYMPFARRAADRADATTERERWWILGSYDLMTSQDQLAIGQFEALVRKYPDDKWGLRNLSVLYGGVGRPQDAVNLRLRIADQRPNDMFAQASAAESLLQTRGLDAARSAVVRARRVMPSAVDTSDGFAMRAKVWVLLFPAHDLWVHRRAKEAAAVLDATGTRPEFAADGFWTLNMLGKLHLTLGQLRLAERAFDRITDPGQRAQSLAEVALARNNLREVVAHLSGSPQTDPSAVSLLIRAGDVGAAERLLGRLTNIDPITLRWAGEEIEEARGDAARVGQALEAGVPWTRVMSGARTFLYSETLARAAVQAGDTAGAIRVLEETGTIDEKTYMFFTQSGFYWTRTQKLLADLYRQVGQIDRARAIERDLLAALAVADEDYPLARELRSRDAPR